MIDYISKGRKFSEFREYFCKELIKIMDSKPDVTLEDLADRLKDAFGINTHSTKNMISRYRAGHLKNSWEKRVPYILQFYDVEPNDEFVVNIKKQFPDFVYPPKELARIYNKIKKLTENQQKKLAEIDRSEFFKPEVIKEIEETLDFLIKKNKKNN